LEEQKWSVEFLAELESSPFRICPQKAEAAREAVSDQVLIGGN
jgi:hypothetical protein